MIPEYNILLVEDDDGESFMIQRMLSQSDEAKFNVDHCVSLKTALQILSFKPEIDLVLLDLSLPDTHGYETVTEFTRASSKPFIVLTGNDDMVMAIRAVKMGAMDYILKGEIKKRQLELAIVIAISKAQREEERIRKSFETFNQLMPPEKATVAYLTPRILRLVRFVEDVGSFIASTAPGLREDLQAILDKHGVLSSIREIRNVLKNNGERELRDSAIQIFDNIRDKYAEDSSPPTSWEEAEEFLDSAVRSGT